MQGRRVEWRGGVLWLCYVFLPGGCHFCCETPHGGWGWRVKQRVNWRYVINVWPSVGAKDCRYLHSYFPLINLVIQLWMEANRKYFCFSAKSLREDGGLYFGHFRPLWMKPQPRKSDFEDPVVDQNSHEFSFNYRVI